MWHFLDFGQQLAIIIVRDRFNLLAVNTVDQRGKSHVLWRYVRVNHIQILAHVLQFLSGFFTVVIPDKLCQLDDVSIKVIDGRPDASVNQ